MDYRLKLNAIVESYQNGQRKQMVQQIKNYGMQQFFLDFYRNIQMLSVTDGEFAAITYTFFLLK